MVYCLRKNSSFCVVLRVPRETKKDNSKLKLTFTYLLFMLFALVIKAQQPNLATLFLATSSARQYINEIDTTNPTTFTLNVADLQYQQVLNQTEIGRASCRERV